MTRTRRRNRVLVALLATLGLIVPVAAVSADIATAGPALAAGPGTNSAVDDAFTSARTAWWRDSRFGMFIHFGAYSFLEGEYTRSDGTICRDAEWIKRRCNIPMAQYESFAQQFNPSQFSAPAIVQLAKDAGQKYIVITSKHHEGYAMWPTKVNTWNLRDHSSFDKTRDILAELKAEADRQGVKLGFYYSIWDWHDPDFETNFPAYKTRMYAQLKELVDNYHPALLWFDGEWNTTNPTNNWSPSDGEQLQEYLRSLDPTLVVNNRVGKRRVVDGDFGTPEQQIPADQVEGQPWESCMTINGHWGFQRSLGLRPLRHQLEVRHHADPQPARHRRAQRQLPAQHRTGQPGPGAHRFGGSASRHGVVAAYERPGRGGVPRRPARCGGRPELGCGEPAGQQAVPVGVLLAGCGQPGAPAGARPVPDHRGPGAGQRPGGDLADRG